MIFRNKTYKMNLEEIEQKIEEISKRKRSCDDNDFDTMDDGGGSFEHAYSVGFEDGYITMAQELLAELNK